MDAKSPICSRQQIVQFAREHLRTGGPNSDQIRRHFGLQKRAFFTQLDTHLDDSALSMPEKLHSAASADRRIEGARSNV